MKIMLCSVADQGGDIDEVPTLFDPVPGGFLAESKWSDGPPCD